MQLSRFARRRYTPHPTPIEFLSRLTKHVGGPKIFVKRDDQTGLAGGGNKTRKLEFLVADALAKGADTLITVGAVQSNHCRLTLAAAAREGLRCQLVLEQRVPKSYDPHSSGNNFLFDLLGVERVHVVDAGADVAAKMNQVAAELASAGRKAYVIAGGGSSPLGALGYVACAQEIMAQTFELGLKLDHIVCVSGSAGTHAGLITGLIAANAGIPLTGISVRRERAEQETLVHKLASATADLLELAGGVPRESVIVFDEWVGPGYSLPSPEMIDAVRLVARMEGVLLDPVYTGKAMAGTIALAKRGHFGRDTSVLFLHTGGTPSLFAYQDVLRSS
jgi:D-cysteine desulfhydrase